MGSRLEGNLYFIARYKLKPILGVTQALLRMLANHETQLLGEFAQRVFCFIHISL